MNATNHAVTHAATTDDRVSIRILIACGVAPTQARIFGPLLGSIFSRFRIDTVLQRAGFLSQAIHDSAALVRLEDGLYFTTPEKILDRFRPLLGSGGLGGAAELCRRPIRLANRIYDGRLGNSSVADADDPHADGWRYRPRGIFRIVGRANYMAAGDALGKTYKAQPELVGEAEGALLTAGWVWAVSGCNELMLSGDFPGVLRHLAHPSEIEEGDGGRERRAIFAACSEAISREGGAGSRNGG